MATEAIREKEQKRYRPKKKAVFGVGLLIFAIFCALAMFISNFRVQNAEQAILNQQRDIQQAGLDKYLDSIRLWHNEILEQARYITSAEMIRLFMADARSLSAEEMAALAQPDASHSPDEAVRSLAEQLSYIQDLLTDFTKRRAWTDARLLLPDGAAMVAPQFSLPLTEAQKELSRKAALQGHAIFGPLRETDQGIVLDLADPLFEVMGAAEPKAVAVLLLSIPMNRTLTRFLSRSGEQTETIWPRIVDRDGNTLFMVFADAGSLKIEPFNSDFKKLEPLPFMRRKSLGGKTEVFSIGGLPTGLNWLYVLETPATEVESIIDSQKMQIYGTGIFASLSLALLSAWFWAIYKGRRHEAEAARYENLYHTISNQKMMLDSINSSFKAGLVLVDVYGRVQICNPAFREICGIKEEIKAGTPLVECFPRKEALNILQDMRTVGDIGQSATVEIALPDPADEKEQRLYRVTLYPYSDTEDKKSVNSGCVAIFQDITEFRRKAIAERKKAENERLRQDALISAFVRAVENVDPGLVGHSDKMAGISELLAKELELNEQQEETLKLAAKLSQVGKIYVPRELLTKKGNLTQEEKQELRRAPEYADKILHDLHFDLPVRETVRLIGERVDGSGKPLGLVGEQISLCGRALEVVNAFIAMTSPRAWRGDKGISIEEAIHNLGNDKAFDQNIVGALGRLAKADIARVLQTTGNAS